jgi:hypothetical protein
MASATLTFRPPIFYDAEFHIGLQAEDSSLSVATANTRILNEALAAMWMGGLFTFARGEPGPVLYPIAFAPREFFFLGGLQTSPRCGGALCGDLGWADQQATSQYVDGTGGLAARLTRIDGEAGGPFFRLRGGNFTLDGLGLKGQPQAEADYTGTASPALVEIEDRPGPSGAHVIRNCALAGGTRGIHVLAGYYDDSAVLVPHSGSLRPSCVERVQFANLEQFYYCENAAATNWRFTSLVGSADDPATTVFDLVRGSVIANHVTLPAAQTELFRVHEFDRQNQRLTCDNLHWSEHNGSGDYLSLFRYAGTATDAAALHWSVRVRGSIDNDLEPTYDTTKLIQIAATAAGFPLDDLRFDIAQLPPNGFQQSGEWFIPTGLLLS